MKNLFDLAERLWTPRCENGIFCALKIGNFGPRNSVGLYVEMTAGSARSPLSCRVEGAGGRGSEGWRREGGGARGNPGHPLPRRLGCIYRPTDGGAERARPLTRAHMRKRERGRDSLTLIRVWFAGLNFDGLYRTSVVGDRSSIILGAVNNKRLLRDT